MVAPLAADVRVADPAEEPAHELLPQQRLRAVDPTDLLLDQRFGQRGRRRGVARHQIPQALVEADRLERQRGAELERDAARQVQRARDRDGGVAEHRAHLLGIGGLAIDAAAEGEGEALRRAVDADEARVRRPAQDRHPRVLGHIEARVAARRGRRRARQRRIPLDQHRVEPQPRDQGQAAEYDLGGRERRRVHGQDVPAVVGDRVAGRVAEDGDVAFAGGEGERAVAGLIDGARLEVEPEAQGRRGGDPAPIGGAQRVLPGSLGDGDRRLAEQRLVAGVVVADRRRDDHAGAVGQQAGVAEKQPLPRQVGVLRADLQGIVGGDRAPQVIVGGQEGRRQLLVLAQRQRGAGLVVVVTRNGDEVPDVVRSDLLGQPVEVAVAPGDRQPQARGDGQRDEPGGVHGVGGDVAVHPVLGQRAQLDADQAAQAAPVVGAERARRQIDRADEIRVDRRAEAADVVQRRDLDAFDVDPGLPGRRAPDDQLAGAERRAGDAGQVLHHLERVALGPGDAPRLLGADAGLDRLLLDARGPHDDRDPLLVVVLLLDAGTSRCGACR